MFAFYTSAPGRQPLVYPGIAIVNGSGNQMEGNEIGIDPQGSFGGNGNDGVKFEGDLAMNNIIGGPAPGTATRLPAMPRMAWALSMAHPKKTMSKATPSAP
jgi:hypothetical protein